MEFSRLSRISRHLAPDLFPLRQPRSTMTSSATNRSATSHKVKVDDVMIHYELAGNGNHVVLLLPGSLGCSRTDFEYQVEGFNPTKFTVVAWDPRGYGKSIPPERTWPKTGYLHRDMRDAAKLMEILNYRKYSLVGWSDGGITAMILAAAYPERVRKMVVLGANAFTTAEEMDNLEQFRDIDNWSERQRAPLVKQYGDAYLRKHWSLMLDAYRIYLTTYKGDICKGGLAKIQCPTLILHGDQDPVTLPYHSNYLHQHIKDSRLHIMKGGKHNIHQKFHKEFNEIVENFLNSA